MNSQDKIQTFLEVELEGWLRIALQELENLVENYPLMPPPTGLCQNLESQYNHSPANPVEVRFVLTASQPPILPKLILTDGQKRTHSLTPLPTPTTSAPTDSLIQKILSSSTPEWIQNLNQALKKLIALCQTYQQKRARQIEKTLQKHEEQLARVATEATILRLEESPWSETK